MVGKLNTTQNWDVYSIRSKIISFVCIIYTVSLKKANQEAA